MLAEVGWPGARSATCPRRPQVSSGGTEWSPTEAVVEVVTPAPPSVGAPTPAGQASDVRRFALAGVAILALSVAAVRLRVDGADSSLWWPAAGASVAAVVSVCARHRAVMVALVALVTAAGNLVGGRPLDLSLWLGAADAAEAAVAGWWILRGSPGRPTMTTLGDLWRLVVGGLLGTVVVAVGIRVAVVSLVGSATAWATFPHVAASHLSAVLLIVPLVLRASGTRADAGRTETVLQWVATLTLTAYAFGPRWGLPLSFVPLAPLMWGALRLAVRAVVRQLVVVLLGVSVLTVLGGGSFTAAADSSADPMLAATLVETYLLVTVLAVLSLALAVDQRRSALVQVSRSERLFRAGFQDALQGTVILRRSLVSLRIVELNGIAAGLLGGPPPTLTGTDWFDHVRDDDGDFRRAVAVLCRGRSRGWRGELRLAMPSCADARWVEVAAARIESVVGVDLLIVHLVDVTARREAEAALSRIALHDPLTDLPNRTLLRSRIEQALELDHEDGSSLALLFLDLDDFKRVNDSMGHEAGDDLLVRVSDRLRGAVRASDTVARLGGDEFCVLLPAIEPDCVQGAVDRVLESLVAPISIPAGTYRVSASIGVVKDSSGSTVSGLLRDADTAMYVSKKSGGGRATFFDDTYRARALRGLEIAQEFDGAVARGELRLYAQPVVDLATGRVVSAETLVRWQHPQRGLLPPGEWLDVAEGSPSGEDLDRWVLWESCRLAAAWTASTGSAGLRVHVNVSGRQVQRGDLLEQVLAALDETGLPAPCLVVELTEDQLDEVGGSLSQDLAELRRRGIGLAVDDFGTGYSAFGRLIDYPVDMVKIDRAFVARMLHEERSRAIVDLVVRLARRLHLDVVAEGVETEEQARYLRSIGCGLAQGYLWSRPLSPEDFTGLLPPGGPGTVEERPGPVDGEPLTGRRVYAGVVDHSGGTCRTAVPANAPAARSARAVSASAME